MFCANKMELIAIIFLKNTKNLMNKPKIFFTAHLVGRDKTIENLLKNIKSVHYKKAKFVI